MTCGLWQLLEFQTPAFQQEPVSGWPGSPGGLLPTLGVITRPLNGSIGPYRLTAVLQSVITSMILSLFSNSH